MFQQRVITRVYSVLVNNRRFVCREDLFEYSDLLSNTAEVNLRHAFNLAAQHLDVPRLLEPEGQFM